jgi:hypothetical protein
MKPGTASWYRSRAATARTMAAGLSDPVSRKAMLAVATNYDRIAFSRVDDGALERVAVIQDRNTFYAMKPPGGASRAPPVFVLARYPLPVMDWDSKGTASARIWFEAWCAERGYEPVYVT